MSCKILFSMTKARFSALNPTVACESTHHLSDHLLQTMIRSANSPFSDKGRQGAPSLTRSSFLDQEFTRATLHASQQHEMDLPLVTSSTVVPPAFVQWRPWPPQCRGETATADSCAVIPGRIARPHARPRPTNSAASCCLAYRSNPVATCHRCCTRSGSNPDNSPTACSWESARWGPASAQRPMP